MKIKKDLKLAVEQIKRIIIITLIISLSIASQVFAKVRAIEFDNFVQNSEVIVIATVDSVSWAIIGKRYAKASVMQVWKGPQVKTVEFLASPTWTCDISEAKRGEDVLLFLSKSDESQSYVIAHSGRGRMPLRTVEGKTYATFWPEIWLPVGTPTIKGPDPQYNFIKSIEISILRDLVKKSIGGKVKTKIK